LFVFKAVGMNVGCYVDGVFACGPAVEVVVGLDSGVEDSVGTWVAGLLAHIFGTFTTWESADIGG